jgi:hypothetical protein
MVYFILANTLLAWELRVGNWEIFEFPDAFTAIATKVKRAK